LRPWSSRRSGATYRVLDFSTETTVYPSSGGTVDNYLVRWSIVGTAGGERFASPLTAHITVMPNGDVVVSRYDDVNGCP
jgi:hypothetical protein